MLYAFDFSSSDELKAKRQNFDTAKKLTGKIADRLKFGLAVSCLIALSSCSFQSGPSIYQPQPQPSYPTTVYQQSDYRPYSLSSSGVAVQRSVQRPVAQQPVYRPQPLPAIPQALVLVSKTVTGSVQQASPTVDYGKFKQVFATTLGKWGQAKNTEVKAVVDFYSSIGGAPLWYRQEGWNPAALLSHETLRHAGHDGLNAQTYLPGSNYELRDLKLVDDLVGAEIMLTQGLLKYLVDVRKGMLVNASRSEGAKILVQGLQSKDYRKWLASVRPQSRQYQGLRNAMANSTLEPSQRRKIALNMERLRKPEPSRSSRHLRLNLPAFTLEAFDGKRLAFDMPVVIGQQERPTPVMADKIVDLKFSPDWSVPNIVAKGDILPLLKAKVPVLEKMGVVVQKRGKRVKNPHKINWNKYSANNLPYTFWQPPGPKNALGGVRFSLTNPDAIFMHDSPEKDKFVLAQRLVSSGCIRVGDAIGLSHWIMSTDAGWSKDLVLRKMTSGRTETVRLKEHVPVDIVYYTAWIDKQGYLKFGDDVYGHDATMAKRIGI